MKPKGKNRVLHTGRNNPVHQHWLGKNQLESSLAEKDVLMDKLNMNQQNVTVAKAAKSLLGCTRGGVLPEGQRMHSFNPSPLLGTGETTTGLLWPVLGSPVPGRYQHSAASLLLMIKESEHPTYKKRLRDLGLFSFEKRRLRQGDLFNVKIHLMQGVKKTPRQFPVVSNRARDNGHKTQNNLFEGKNTHFSEPQNMFLRGVVESSSSELSKPQMGTALSSLL